MSKDLVPPELRSDATPQLRAIAGTIVGHPWQPRFYFQLDAFLAAVTIGKVWNSFVFMQREMPSVLERLEQRPDGRLTGRGSSKAFQGAMAMAEMPGSTGKRSTMVSDAVSRTAMLPNDSVMKARASSGVSATRPPSSPSGTRVTACVGVS